VIDLEDGPLRLTLSLPIGWITFSRRATHTAALLTIEISTVHRLLM
jgi:hypothetical protein